MKLASLCAVSRRLFPCGRKSVRRFQLEIIQTIDRLDLDVPFFLVLQHVERNRDAGPAHSPDLAIEIGEILRRFARYSDDDIAAPHPRLLRRTLGSPTVDDQALAHFLGGEPQPRPPRSRNSPA